MPTPSFAASSRRSFLRLAGLSAAALPILSESDFARAAQAQTASQTVSPPPRANRVHASGTVLINANENPLGPCSSALDAIASAAKTGGRYDASDFQGTLTRTFAAQNGLPESHIAVYAGSSEPLSYTVLAFTGPDRPLVMANPTYEAAMWLLGPKSATPILQVPLTPTYAHDVRAMVAAAPNAGLLYICNPNNPTGTLTSREDILWALENKPKGAILLVDEAYIHLSDAPSVLDQVAAGKDLIVLRTFSKVYGMAGIRCGFACARPDLLARYMQYGQNSMPVTALAAATASLQDAALVPARKKIIAETRNDTFAWLTAKGYKFIPSVSNCFMIDTGRPGREVMKAMAGKGVMIGRVWPIWPTYVRISVGTPAEMARFKEAFAQVMA